MSPESVSRTFIGSVVCVDLVGYSTKPVAQQIQVKEAFNRLLAGSLKRVPEEDRIILDTGDGAAISFLGDPETTLTVGLAIRDATHAHAAELGAGSAPGEGAVRIGINLGSVKLALDMNGYPRIVGDGINVAERIAAFAKPGEVVVSHSFYDMVSRLSEANAKLFRSEGKRTDKNGREHQIYAVRRPGEAEAETVPAAHGVTMPPSLHARSTAAPAPAPAGRGALVTFLEDRFKVGFAAALLVALIAAEAMLMVRSPSQGVPPIAAAPSVAPVDPAPRSAPQPEPLKAAPVKPEPVKPEPVKVEPPKPEPVKTEPVKAEAKVEPPKPEPPKPETTKTAPVKAETKPEPPKSTTAKADPKPAAKRAEEARPAPAAQPEWKPPEPPREAPKEEPKAVAAATTAVTPVSRSSVNFPAAAAAKNVDSGVVKARVTINAEGKVTAVQILEARPRRYFDEEAARSLREWRFNAGADNRTYDVEIAFQR